MGMIAKNIGIPAFLLNLWIPCDTLLKTQQKEVSWSANQSPIMGTSIGGQKKARIQSITNEYPGGASFICIAKYLQMFMGLYRRIMRFTTLMATLTTTWLKIWRLFSESIIKRNTGGHALRQCKAISTILDRSRRRGTAAKKGGSGTLKMRGLHIKTESRSERSALSVVNGLMTSLAGTVQFFVPMPVSLKTEDRQRQTILKRIAQCVNQCSPQTNTGLPPLAQGVAPTPTEHRRSNNLSIQRSLTPRLVTALSPLSFSLTKWGVP